jgi:hypothetical protein
MSTPLALTGRADRGWVKPPAVLLALAAVVAAVGIGMTVVGSQRIGVSTDEPGHVRRLNSYLAFGLYTRPFEMERTAPGEIPTGAYIYGPVTSILQHDANRLLGREPSYEAKTRAYQYSVRHAVIGSMAIAGLLCAAAISWILLGNWRWGVVTAGILAAIPMWTGHGMFNPKDVPVALAHTLITGALILLALAKPTAKLWLLLAGAVPLSAGTILMLGTRPEVWPSLLASLVVFGIVLFRAHAEQTRWSLARLSLTVVGSLAVSYAVLRAIYPRVYSDLVEVLIVSVFTGAKYDGLGDQAPSDRTYLPVHFLTDLPLGLVALMGVGTAFALRVAFQRRHSARVDCLALVGSQAFAIMIAAFIFDAVLYQGLRQMLFAIPAMAILATVGLAALLTKATTTRWRVAVAGAAGLALVLPTAAQAAVFPYQYSYVNVLAEQTGVVGHDGPDYFATSFREYAYTGPQDVKVVCPFLRFGGVVKRSDADCRTRFAHTFSAFWRGRPTPDRPKAGEFYALLRGSRPTPPNCTPYRQVERRVHVKMVVMSRMFKCHPPTAPEKLAGEKMKLDERAIQGWKRGPGGEGWVPAAG